LRDGLGLHRLDLRLGRLRIRGSLQLLGGRGELGYQGGRVGQQAGPQFRRAGGGHGDRPVQVGRGRRAPGCLAVQCRAGPERRHRGVLRPSLVVGKVAVLRLAAAALEGRGALGPLAPGVGARRRGKLLPGIGDDAVAAARRLGMLRRSAGFSCSAGRHGGVTGCAA
jgi:hypothetical protein